MRLENDLSASFQQLRDERVHLGLSVVLFGLLALSSGYIAGAFLAGTPVDDLLSLFVVGVVSPLGVLCLLLDDAGSGGT